MSRQNSRYGGNTSCMTAESGGDMLILDAGSGIIALQEELFGRSGKSEKPVHILVSHLHLDHIVGLGTFAPAWGADATAHIYTCSRDSRPLREQIFGVFSPPYWPVAMTELSGANVIQVEPNVPFEIGVFTVTPFLAKHPDKTLSFHVTDGKKSFVHLLDSETSKMNRAEHEELARFCKNTDVVVFDAAYSVEEYRIYEGWGHSTVADGVALAAEWNCKHMLFCHLGRHYTDDELDSWIKDLDGEKFIMSYDGFEMEI